MSANLNVSFEIHDFDRSKSDDLLNVRITIVGQNMEVNIKQNGTTNVETIK